MFQAQGMEELIGAGASLVARDAVDVAGEEEVLFDREVVEEPEVFGQDADAALQFQGIPGAIEAADRDFAGSGGEPRWVRERRRFSRSRLRG